MTDRERLLGIINGNDKLNFIEDILKQYLYAYYDNISSLQLSEMMADINNTLREKVIEFNKIKCVSEERAFYLKTYLSGEMWLTEEAAKANIQPQINNAQAIIDACKNL